MTKPGRLALAELWVSLHPGLRGLALGMLIAAALGMFEVPIGPPRRMVGVVDHFGAQESERGSYPVAVVRLADRRVVVVGLTRDHSCIAGGQIRIVQQRYLWGVHFGPDWTPCAPAGLR